MIKASIIGATGYTGAELVRILGRHPQVELVALTSQSYVGQSFVDIYPSLHRFTNLVCAEQDLPRIVADSDVIFIALPHGLAMDAALEGINQGKKVIDLGADFRLDDAVEYEQWYKVSHTAQQLIYEAVYGLPEINREKIKQASLIGNPGCYPTSIILGLAPLLAKGLIDPDSIISDSKSGVSGAGRTLSLGSHYAEVNENIKAYNIGKHRHLPEIEQELGKIANRKMTISFTPHLTPMTRGILSTIYAKLAVEINQEELQAVYRDYYENEYFVRLLSGDNLPQTKWVAGSNFCDIAVTKDNRTNRVVVTSAIDNLVKGASGQAVQNMNIMFGLPENSGLELPGMYP